ncbi:MAG: hypothetical protein FK733_10915 [Asgard group archaeon]|nr:hypothetical protein [Asgard group archaeon]
MRKKAYLTVLLLLVFFVNISFSQGGYHVSAGNIFHYEMALAEVSISLGDNDYVGNGFSIAGHHLAQGYICTLIVDNVYSTHVACTLYGGGYQQSHTSEWVLSDDVSFASLIISWLWKAQPFLTNPTLVSNGLGLIFYPFLEYALSYDFFEEFVDQTYYLLPLQSLSYPNLIFKCYSEEKDGIYFFETSFSGSDEISGGSPEYDLDFKVQLKFAYEKSTGILQGMHYKAEGKGTFNGQPAKYRCESLTLKQYYDLPVFKYGFDISDDWWIIVAAGGGLVLVVTAVLVFSRVGKKKKRKKKPKKKSTKKKKR